MPSRRNGLSAHFFQGKWACLFQIPRKSTYYSNSQRPHASERRLIEHPRTRQVNTGHAPDRAIVHSAHDSSQEPIRQTAQAQALEQERTLKRKYFSSFKLGKIILKLISGKSQCTLKRTVPEGLLKQAAGIIQPSR